MKTTIDTITPDKARKWLQPTINANNRSLRQGHVEYLARQISDGKWQVTHQGIAFDEDGRLLDGQHRLAAIVLAGVAVQMQVSTHLDTTSFQAMDCGLKRAHFDRIHLVNDDAHNRLICTAITTYLRSTTLRGTVIAVSEIEDEFLSKCEAWEWVGRECSALPTRLRLAPYTASLAIYWFIEKVKASDFHEGYKSGAGLVVGSPILKVRNDAMGGDRGCTYWRVQGAMRAHNAGRAVMSLYEATEDMLGNRNSIRLIKKREAKGIKAGVTRRQRGAAVGGRGDD